MASTMREKTNRAYELAQEHTNERLKRGILSYVGVQYGKSDDELEYPRSFYTSDEKYPQRQLTRDELAEIARMVVGDTMGNDEKWDSMQSYELESMIQDEVVEEFPMWGSERFDGKFTYASILAALEAKYGVSHDL